jgi:hypothetical protein
VAIGIGILVIVGGGAILALCYLATHPKNRGGGEGGIGVDHPPPGFNG